MGLGGNDLLVGGTGNDTLIGGAGNDTFVFNLGDGVDTIEDTAAPGEGNTLLFGAGITPDSLSLSLGSLLIRVGSNGDAIHSTNFDPNDALGPHPVDTFQFADGTVLSYSDLIGRGFDLTGTAGDDLISGTNVVDRISGLDGNDKLVGGQGNDILTGGAGNDTYLFNLGDGVDTIHDTAAPGEGNLIQFGAGITAANLNFTQDQTAHTLTIAYDGTGDAIHLADFDPTGANGSLVVSTLMFADGSSVNLADHFSTATNHAPTVASPIADQTTAEDAPFSFAVPANTFADQDVGDTLTLSASLASGDPLPTWLGFDRATGTIRRAHDCPAVTTISRMPTSTDTDNLSVASTFGLTVTPVNDAPTVANPRSDEHTSELQSLAYVVCPLLLADQDV